MKQMFSNATVMWTEREIAEREALIPLLRQIVHDTWTGMNAAIHGCRVETPILTPPAELAGHVAAGFPMLDTKRGTLRPETTAGCVAAFHALYPMANQRKKRLPFYVWQVGKVFRDEERPETMRASKLRLVEFWQMEFELFAAADTKADYLTPVLWAFTERWGGVVETPPDPPHYSRRTIDWEIDGLEIAGCSERTDWDEGVVYEVSIGLDRLVAVLLGRHYKRGG